MPALFPFRDRLSPAARGQAQWKRRGAAAGAGDDAFTRPREADVGTTTSVKKACASTRASARARGVSTNGPLTYRHPGQASREAHSRGSISTTQPASPRNLPRASFKKRRVPFGVVQAQREERPAVRPPMAPYVIIRAHPATARLARPRNSIGFFLFEPPCPNAEGKKSVGHQVRDRRRSPPSGRR